MKSQHDLRDRAFVEGPMFERSNELWQALVAVAECIRHGIPAVTTVEAQ